jgi:sulfite exporter TauE/SafE
MTVNVGIFDRIARVVVGAALLAFALGYLAPGTSWSWVGWIGVLPILTALVGNCPAYSIMRFSTR